MKTLLSYFPGSLGLAKRYLEINGITRATVCPSTEPGFRTAIWVGGEDGNGWHEDYKRTSDAMEDMRKLSEWEGLDLPLFRVTRNGVTVPLWPKAAAPVSQGDREEINLAAPNQQARGFILRPSAPVSQENPAQEQQAGETSSHEVHRLTALESLKAMPPMRRAETVRLSIYLLNEALADSRKLPGAYEILASFGEMERTRNGYKSVDPRRLLDRCKKVKGQLEAI